MGNYFQGIILHSTSTENNSMLSSLTNFLLGKNPATTIIGLLLGGLQGATEPSLEGVIKGVLLAVLGRLTNEVKNYPTK